MHSFSNFNNHVIILYLKIFVRPFAVILNTKTLLLDNDAHKAAQLIIANLFTKNRQNAYRGG